MTSVFHRCTRPVAVGMLWLLLSACGSSTDTASDPGPISGGTVNHTLTSRVSVTDGGAESDGPSDFPSISDSGRFVAFVSDATNLDGIDSNGSSDIYLRDRGTAFTRRISLSAGSLQPNAPALRPRISGDGQVIVFESAADNLEANDSNGVPDVFYAIWSVGRISRANVVVSGNSVGQANGSSFAPEINFDGTVIVYESDATNLVSNDNNGTTDIFRVTLDLVQSNINGDVSRVSLKNANQQESDGISTHPLIDSTGNIVAFLSDATNLVGLADTNNTVDLYVRVIDALSTTRVSVSTTGDQANADVAEPYMTSDGRFLAFVTTASTMVPGDTNTVADVFLHDRNTGVTTRVSVPGGGGQANGPSRQPTISDDGRYVAFISDATNLIATDVNLASDLFVYDTLNATTVRVSDPETGAANGMTLSGHISSDGTQVVFATTSDNMNGNLDENETTDLFARPFP